MRGRDHAPEVDAPQLLRRIGDDEVVEHRRRPGITELGRTRHAVLQLGTPLLHEPGDSPVRRPLAKRPQHPDGEDGGRDERARRPAAASGISGRARTRSTISTTSRLRHTPATRTRDRPHQSGRHPAPPHAGECRPHLSEIPPDASGCHCPRSRPLSHAPQLSHPDQTAATGEGNGPLGRLLHTWADDAAPHRSSSLARGHNLPENSRSGFGNRARGPCPGPHPAPPARRSPPCSDQSP